MQSILGPDETMEESALDWFERVKAKKRRANQNPIYFPTLANGSSGSGDRNDACNGRFHVTDESMRNMCANGFLCQTSKLDELKTRLERWRRKRNSRLNSSSSSSQHSQGRRPVEDTGASTLSPDMAELEQSFLQSFPDGTGISFIDQALSFGAHTRTAKSNNDALELVGVTGTAKTKVLLALASNYAAATCTACLGLKGMEMRNTTMPAVVIFDPEHAVDMDELIRFVRSAILRRWNKTERFRTCLQHLQQSVSGDEDCHNNQGNHDYRMIEKDIQSALGRIHIFRPKDISNGYVAALESLNQSLEQQMVNEMNSRRIRRTDGTSSPLPLPSPSPPVMLLMDSALNAFYQISRFHESLPNGAGLSGRNDFIRQIHRLRSKHGVFLVSTRTTRTTTTWRGSKDASSSSPNANAFRSSGFDGWDKMTTHQISLTRSKSREREKGFQYVAMMNDERVCKYGSTSAVRDKSSHADSRPIPFAITYNGILCGTLTE